MATRRRAAVGWVAAGALALALGGLVYLTDRDASRSLLVPAIPALAGRGWFGGVGGIGQWLPSFVHPFAFSLFSAAVLPAATVWRLAACVGWGVVGAAFEIGQQPQVSAWLARALQHGPGDAAPLRDGSQSLSQYFLRGTFDGGDLLATVLGAAVAAALLLRSRPAHSENQDGS